MTVNDSVSNQPLRRRSPGDDEPTDAWLVSAARELDNPPEYFDRLISELVSTVKTMAHRATLVPTDDAEVSISDRVVKKVLARAVRRAVNRVVVRIDVVTAESGETPTGLSVGVIGRYHDDMLELSDELRRVLAAELVTMLGPQTAAQMAPNIDVTWRDLHTQEWMLNRPD